MTPDLILKVVSLSANCSVNWYVIKMKTGETYQLRTPKTIEEFINDMIRFGVPIYWSNWIDENFEPKDYMRFDKIKPYFNDLLTRMGKAHELL